MFIGINGTTFVHLKQLQVRQLQYQEIYEHTLFVGIEGVPIFEYHFDLKLFKIYIHVMDGFC